MGRELGSHLDRRTDAQLLAASGSDADAFHAVYDRYAQKMYSFFEHRTHSRETSLDLTAETFARAWLGRRGLLSERESISAEPEPAWLDDLSEGMEALPPGQRQAVELRVIHEMSYRQVAASLRCSQTAARIRVSRGLSALRNAMEGEAS